MIIVKNDATNLNINTKSIIMLQEVSFPLLVDFIDLMQTWLTIITYDCHKTSLKIITYDCQSDCHLW